jgi:hypothetical protein
MDRGNGEYMNHKYKNSRLKPSTEEDHRGINLWRARDKQANTPNSAILHTPAMAPYYVISHYVSGVTHVLRARTSSTHRNAPGEKKVCSASFALHLYLTGFNCQVSAS